MKNTYNEKQSYNPTNDQVNIQNPTSKWQSNNKQYIKGNMQMDNENISKLINTYWIN